MDVIKTHKDLKPHGRVGFVPTMGALHPGHLALVQSARAQCDTVVASIFVNPTQFGPTEDLAVYPRPLERDLDLLKEAGCDIVYTPSVSHMYPHGQDAVTVRVNDALTNVLCGASRVGHFDGVCLVLSKFFNQIKPDCVFMGQKDWQQLTVVRHMISALNFDIKVRSVDTVRETDGLALSSRNQYLSVSERAIAPALHKALQGVATGMFAQDARALLLDAGFTRVDYLEVRDENTLAIDAESPRQRAFAAAYLGKTRLIDNVRIPALMA